VGLTLQALLFQHGGITTLGVNTMNIALPAVLLGLLGRKAVLSENYWVRTVGEFACGAGAILLSGLMVAGSLVATGQAFASAAGLIAVAHVPVMVIEGLLTVLVVEFLRRVRPEMLGFRSPS
jgi:cobalt/nickel transport system permease protein